MPPAGGNEQCQQTYAHLQKVCLVSALAYVIVWFAVVFVISASNAARKIVIVLSCLSYYYNFHTSIVNTTQQTILLQINLLCFYFTIINIRSIEIRAIN